MNGSSDIDSLRPQILARTRRLWAQYGGLLRGFKEPEDYVQDGLAHAYPNANGNANEKMAFVSRFIRWRIFEDVRKLLAKGGRPQSLSEAPEPRDRHDGDPPQPDTGLRDRSLELRRLLTEIEPALRCSTSVDYYAVLLVTVRLAAVRLFSRALGSASELPDGCASLTAGVETFVCWLPDEERRSMKAGLPDVGQLWQRLREDIDTAFDAPDISTLCARIAELSSGGAAPNAASWYQWTRRAKVLARKRIGEDQWSRVFGRLLPDPGAAEA